MSKNYQSVLSLLVNQRASELVSTKVSANPVYKGQLSEHNTLFVQVRELLGADNEQLVFSMGEIEATMNGIEVEYAYRQGLHDGIQFLKDVLSVDNEGGLACLV